MISTRCHHVPALTSIWLKGLAYTAKFGHAMIFRLDQTQCVASRRGWAEQRQDEGQGRVPLSDKDRLSVRMEPLISNH